MALITAANVMAYKKSVDNEVACMNTLNNFCQDMEPQVAKVKTELASLIARHSMGSIK